ncbi:NPC1-like intracellular cholesterol transporter 1 isoform X1 [Chiroxiphia lanceolata]|uniref:NPC1-like intracellular cholesterol transporter 1 isoform X1 n=1 Tax=Chiroxiphia lanceolata TaxID=296741 RepID=UPI0013CEEED0|nr:NPC1-like intracellular cholesterol transporter 1 isoform X1 [Chiroxiphia lanceolata]
MAGSLALPGALLAALLALASPSFTPIHRAGYCSFYGECGRNPEVNVSLVPSNVPCLSNTPAQEATGTLLSLLRSVCPDLVQGDNETTLVCCTYSQLIALQLSVALSGTVLARCPSCARNFASLYCHNTCSPDQSLFTNVTRVVNRTLVPGVPSVAVVEYQSFYRQRFADAAFSSCHGVRLPSTGGFAIATMCGRYGAQLCTPQRWLDFQGDKNNGLAPLQINFELVPNGTEPGDAIEPLDAQVWRCSEAPSEDEEPCSCQDCAESCSPVVAPTDSSPPFRLGEADGVLVLCVLLFTFFAMVFLVALLCQRRSKGLTVLQVVPAARGCSGRVGDVSHQALARVFRWWGTLVASRPLVVLAVAVVVAGGLSAGMVTLRLTTDPVELWSAPGSRARQEKAFHDQHFGPFLRTNQIIVTAPGRAGARYDSVILGSKNFSGVLAQDVLQALLELQERLAGIEAWAPQAGRNVTLRDVCYAPLNPTEPTLGDCCVNSVTQYFQNNRSHLALTALQEDGKETGTVDWHDHLIYCVSSPLSFKDITALELSCMAEYGGPVFPYIAFGGYQDSEYTEAEALIITYSLNNFPRGDPRLEWVLSWESKFLEVVQDFQRSHSPNLSVTFMAERSLEDEINRTSGEDLPVFALSYLLVFAYIALALGEYTAWSRVLVESKVTLALGGIAVVLGAVFASMGFLALLGMPSSLIILEVVPFLVLAVGADNIFIFVQEFQQSQREPDETREQHLGRVLAEVAPSMLLCSISEAICFLLGALSSMPAVQTFALTAAVAIAFDFLLQMSGFVALVALDARRQEAGRFDLCCCCGKGRGGPAGEGARLLRPLLERYYTPFLLHPRVRPCVVLLFLFLACAGLFLLFQVPVGLDQELALPKDSYMLQYFSALNQYLAVGVPTYFVTTGGYNFSSANGTNAICSSAGCDSDSLTQTIQYATNFPNVSYLAIPATSWVDDFLDWLNPTSRCCRIHQFGEHKGEFCPSTSNNLSCVAGQCLNTLRRPTAEEFQRFLPWFLQDRPTLQCAKGGLGAYDTSVSMDENGTILATRFMAYQRPLRTSQEYTAALRAARALGDTLTRTLRRVPGTDPHFSVFPYTVTYVYYEQYLTVVVEGLVTLAMCLVPTFAVSFLLLGMDLRSSCATLVTIAMILLDTVGAMALWDVPYNAVALINLVAAVGISVEFVSHITCAFARSAQPTRVERAAEATITMGSKVVTGVAMTSLPGVVVLAFAKAQLIQIFFFRLNFIITLVGLAHGLVFLPVLLSYIGPSPRVPAGDMPGDTQGAGLGSGTTYFKDKDMDKPRKS